MNRQRYVRHSGLTEKPLVLYPAGEYGRRMLKMLRSLQVEPVAFCDSSKEKAGTVIDGVKVYSLKELLELYGTEGVKYVVNSSYNYPQIEKKLTGCGIPMDCILSPDIISYCDTGKIPRPIQISAEQKKQLKGCLLELLFFVHTTCEKYGIPYFITSGTLLGAVRHGGFIPWDDDVDVAMLRKDYKRFCHVVSRELGDRYTIQELPSRKAIALRDSEICLFGDRHSMKIMIDIFPLDTVFAFPNSFNLFQERASMTLFRWAGRFHWYENKRGIGRFFRWLGCSIHQLCNVCSTEWFHYFVPDTPNLYKNRVYNKNLIGKRTQLKFEGHPLFGPEHYDEMLQQMFGREYMELPPVEIQVGGHALSKLKLPEKDSLT